MAMAVSLFSPVLTVIQAVHNLTKEHKGVWSQLRAGIRSLKDEMEIIQEDIAKYEEQKLQELAYDIEDFIHSLTTPGASGFVLTVLGRNPSDDELVTVGYFKDRIEKLQKRQDSQRVAAKAGDTTSEASSSIFNHDTELVGNAKPEFEELLSAVDNSRLSVISIVGCRGLGKTALARAVYKEAGSVVPGGGGFHCKAWVVASKYKDDLQGLLNKILHQILKESEASGSSSLVTRPVTTTQETVYAALHNKRYLVVIDDMLEEHMWDDVQSSFPDTAGSIIVVTTSIQSIATYLGRNNGRVHESVHTPEGVRPPFQDKKRSHHRYSMPYLDIESSRKLLQQKMGNPPLGSIVDEDIILRKCDGLPLSLVSVANFLRPNLARCSDVAKSLGTHIAGTKRAFGDLKRTLAQCYGSLPGYQERRCLLSVSMFPQGHQINMKSLLRKWIAEGLVAELGQRNAMNIAYNSSNEFLDRSIIDPVLISSNSHVKRSQVKGTMLEFIVHNSTCATNFATLIHRHGRLPTASSGHPIRRLFVWDGGIQEVARFSENEENVRFIRWLALCTSVRFDLGKCRLLRVLDLEGCTGVVREVLQNICKLVFLKYLSLRNSDASEIPKEIKSLMNLETLDIRGTKVKLLPIEVAMLPGLVHIFGQFELVRPYKSFMRKAARIMVKGKEVNRAKPPSKLETLAGVIIDNEGECFQQIMLHAKELKKVKIRCNKTAATHLIPVEKFCGDQVLESLSVDCSEPIRLLSDEFLESLSGACLIKSLNLRGKLEGLPATLDNFMKLQKVEELQLSSTGRRWEDLSVLQKMHGLLYLKLTEDHHDSGEGSFIVQEDGFQCLRRLCIQAPMVPKLQFKEGAMPCLASLELLQTAEATPEVTTPQPEAALQVGVTSEMISPQPEAIPHTEATPEVTTPQSEAPLHTRAALQIITRQLEIISLPETPLQPGATSEITTPQTVGPLLTEETAEIEPDLGVEGLSHLVRLNEVILHHSAPDATVREWKIEAKKHVNRPQVKKQPEGPEPNINAE